MVPIRSPFRSEPDSSRGRSRAPEPSFPERLAGAIGHGSSLDGAIAGAIASAITAGGGKALQRWASSHSPSWRRLLRGAAAGAGAAGVLHLYRRFTGDAEGVDLVDELLAGIGRGMVYTAVLDPLLPGPPIVRGATVGVAEYMLQPWGGLITQLQGLSPARRLPLVGALLETGDAEEDPFVAFVLYGIALGVLSGDG